MIEYINFEKLNKRISELETDTVLIVIDQNIWSEYRDRLPLEQGSLGDKRIILWKAPDGEKVKNFNDYQSCIEFFIEKGVHRNSHLVAIGGGATSDMAGFVAATLLRGIAWSVVPTTLLAMVDASIGGKTSINSKYGKNLIGAFHHPQNVFVNMEFLYTLQDNQMNSGKGEILKYMMLSRDVFDIGVRNHEVNQELIKACIEFKENIVKEDFKESGKRKILNLGHTFGHGIERHFNLTHGKSVALGMLLMFVVMDDKQALKLLRKANENIPVIGESTPWLNKVFPLDEILEFLGKDKKASSSMELDIVRIESLGKPVIESISFSKLQEKLMSKLDVIKTYVL